MCTGAVRGVRALLEWCRLQLSHYPGLNILDMSASWRDGRAFCALIHSFRPDLINFSRLSSDPATNCRLAFTTAERFLGIPRLLDVSDVVDSQYPEQLSVITYVSLFYHQFSRAKKGLVHSLMFTNDTGPVIKDRENPFIAELEKYRVDKGRIHEEIADIFQVNPRQPPPPPSIECKHRDGELRERANTGPGTGDSIRRQSTMIAGSKHKCNPMYKILISNFNRIFSNMLNFADDK